MLYVNYGSIMLEEKIKQLREKRVRRGTGNLLEVMELLHMLIW